MCGRNPQRKAGKPNPRPLLFYGYRFDPKNAHQKLYEIAKDNLRLAGLLKLYEAGEYAAYEDFLLACIRSLHMENLEYRRIIAQMGGDT